MLLALAGALVAGALTTLSPCTLSVLPVILGGSLDPGSRAAPARRAVAIALGLGASVFLFTLLLRASTALIGVPAWAWRWLSGGLLIALGLAALAPSLWDRVAVATGMSRASAAGLHGAAGRPGLSGAALTGAALGPVFTSCSPLYAYVVVTVLPSDRARGLTLLTAYVIGLVGVLLVIALLGQRAVAKVRWAADPHSRVRRGLGLGFIVMGLLIATGTLVRLETWLVQSSPIRPWELFAP
ncbi:cytochrome c biogenesis protein CcdA [Nostocoides sp.]|uniref:cytochrome c biogenesis protein CcdA n=1 Tax=Nostocoides sp. TaxID=1917966 RepID=UPI002C31171D|nr:cytochrome c biogenesis protein CcdA [Tetrasphaera sp.]